MGLHKEEQHLEKMLLKLQYVLCMILIQEAVS